MNSIDKYDHPYVTVDGVVLKTSYDTFSDPQKAPKLRFQALLVQRPIEPQKGSWSLPGGFVDIDKELDEALITKIFQKTGLVSYYMEQLKTFGKIGRDERGRVLTVAYIILLNEYNETLPENAKWFYIDGDNLVNEDEKIKISDLAFDHEEILAEALKRIEGKVWYSDIPQYLLAPEFTIKEAQDLFELIENKRTGSFRRQLGDRIISVKDKQLDTKGRPAQIYRWNRNR